MVKNIEYTHLNWTWKEIPDKDLNVYRPHGFVAPTSRMPRLESTTVRERDHHRSHLAFNTYQNSDPRFSIEKFFPPRIISTMQVDDRYHCVKKKEKKREKQSQGSNQVSHIHRHLLHSCIVKRLDVPKNPLVFLSDEVDSNSFSSKTAATTNSREETKTLDSQEETKGGAHLLQYNSCLWM